MPREIVIRSACGMSAANFWSLRSDTGFDDWFCKQDKQIFDLVKNTPFVGANGASSIDRVFHMYMQEEHVPKAIRAMLPAANKFFVKVIAQFSTHLFDEKHPYTYTAIYPIFTERIHVHGRQWAEPLSDKSCRLHARIQVKVDIALVGGAVERWIEQLVRSTYDVLPAR